MVFPPATVVAMPTGDMVATSREEEDHATESARSCVVPSERLPCTSNNFLNPAGNLKVEGETVMPVTTEGFTAREDVAVRLETVAVMVAFPLLTAVARPQVPTAFEIVATAVFEERFAAETLAGQMTAYLQEIIEG